MINPVKQDYVDKICNAAKESGIVNRLIVFGSAVTEHCSHESDLDICVDTDCADNNRELFKLYARMSKICDYNCDILTYSKLGKDSKRKLTKQGLLFTLWGQADANNPLAKIFYETTDHNVIKGRQ